MGLSAPLPVRKLEFTAGDNNDLALIDEDLQHLKMNIPCHMVSRDEIVNEVFANHAVQKNEMQM